MSSVSVFEFTREQLEDRYDSIKSLVLNALVAEELISEPIAEKWCGSHTLIMRKKGFFRTISDAWRKCKPEKDHYHTIVVAIPETKTKEESAE